MKATEAKLKHVNMQRKEYKKPEIRTKGGIVISASHGCHDSWKDERVCSKTW